MKVNPKGQPWPASTYTGSVGRPNGATVDTGAAAESVAAGRDDQVALSDRARQLNVFRQQLQSSPEMRTELVERLRSQIARGEYKVNPHDLAERLLAAKVVES